MVRVRVASGQLDLFNLKRKTRGVKKKKKDKTHGCY